MFMDLCYIFLPLVLWGLAYRLLALPEYVVRVDPVYSSWVDCASLIGDI